MIYVIAILAIALLIASVGWVNTRIALRKTELLQKSQAQELQQLEQSFTKLVDEQEEELGFGMYVKWRAVKKPTSMIYKLTFDMDPNGQRILEELTTRFKRNVFTDNERETCRRLGRAEVIDFIINRINTANDPRYSEALELAHMEQNDE